MKKVKIFHRNYLLLITVILLKINLNFVVIQCDYKVQNTLAQCFVAQYSYPLPNESAGYYFCTFY